MMPAVWLIYPREVQQASSSIGRAAVSKTAGWGFDSLLACHGFRDPRRLHRRLILRSFMNGQTETGASALDTVKLLLSIAVLVGGLVGYYQFQDLSILIRAIGVLASVVISIVIVLQTARGRDMWQFIQGSRVELRKVVWPNRQDTTQTTLAVIVFVIILGVFFWALDLGLLWTTKTLTGQGG